MKRHLILLFLVSAFGTACSEAPLISPSGSARLNNPSSMALIPGTNFGVVVNGNVNLTQVSGTLVAVDLTSRTLLIDTAIPIPSFGGRVLVDVARARLYVPDRGNNALLVYDYAIPGTNGQPISFTPVAVTNPADLTSNGIQTDENPYDAVLATNTSQGDLLLVTNNIGGSTTMIPTATLAPLTLDTDDPKVRGLPLISAANFRQKSRRPGAGANRIVSTPDKKLLYVTSTRSSDIYVIDPRDQQVEVMLDLSTLSTSGGTRGMAIATTGLAYIAHRGLRSVVVLNVSGITDNGINYEVADLKLIDIIPVGSDPEAVVLSPDEKTLFVTNQGDNTVAVIDVTQRNVKMQVTVGSAPGEIVVDADPARHVLYVLNFVSNTISVLDLTTAAIVGTIQ